MLLDYRFIELLLKAAQDPEVSLNTCAKSVRVRPGVRLPRLPALYKAKKRWRPPEQADPMDRTFEAIQMGSDLAQELCIGRCIWPRRSSRTRRGECNEDDGARGPN